MLPVERFIAKKISFLQGNNISQVDTEKLPAGAYMLMLKNASTETEMQAKFMKY